MAFAMIITGVGVCTCICVCVYVKTWPMDDSDAQNVKGRRK